MVKSYEPWSGLYGVTQHFFRFTGTALMHVEGARYIPKEPSVILAKHRSLLEVLQLSYVVGVRTGKMPLIAMNAGLPKQYGWFGGVPIDRGSDQKEMSQKEFNARSFARLRQGLEERSIIAFPEGHRWPDRMGRLLTGLLGELVNNQYPVVPAGVNHSWLSLTNKIKIPYGSTIKFGPPRTYHSVKDMNIRAFREELATLSGLELKVKSEE